MAKRRLQIDIDCTKWSRVFGLEHFIGIIQLVYNGKPSNEYMLEDKGIVNLSKPGASRYYADYGFDWGNRDYFSAYEMKQDHRHHIIHFTIDESSATLSLKYGLFNKSTGTITIPKGLDDYRVECRYENGFEPRLILVQSYAQKTAVRKMEIEKENRTRSETLKRSALSAMNLFSNELNSYFLHGKDDRTAVDALDVYLTTAKESLERMPCQDMVTYSLRSQIQLLEKQNSHFYDYVMNKISMKHSMTILQNDYGKVKENLIEEAKRISKYDADQFVNQFVEYYEKADWLHFCEIDVERVLPVLWFYGMYKPHDSQQFQKSCQLYHNVYRTENSDPLLAGCFATMLVTGEDGVADKIRKVMSEVNQIKNLQAKEHKKQAFHQIASGLMWMKAYKAEREVLEFMFQNGMQMTAKELERLHMLTTSKGMEINSLQSNCDLDRLSIRMDSLSWKQDEVQAFFDNLAFQDKRFEGILALRDEQQDFSIGIKTKFPSILQMEKEIQHVFEEEYGDVVKVSAEKAYSLTADESEEIEGLYAVTEEVPSLGMFVLVIRIGKKLNIKFYTLYLPDDVSADQQAKKAISMQKNLSPTITMWEKSIKETFLSAIQRILNADSSKSTTNTEDIVEF